MEPAGGQGGSAGQTIRIERMLPLYEAKMMGAYDHRSADVVKSPTAGKRQNQPRYLTSAEHKDPWRFALPLTWVPEDSLPEVPAWLAGFSDITSATNERTVLSGALPRAGVGHTYPLYIAAEAATLLPIFNSLVLDYVARQKVAGLHLTYGYVKQFPTPQPEDLNRPTPFTAPHSFADWLRPRILELTYTAWDMAPFAEDLDDLDPITGRVNPPFIWDDDRRAPLRAEIDAAFFHLYGISRNDVDYILDTFPIVRKHDEQRFGEYRTKAHILDCYDAMARAIETPYTSPLDPVPGAGQRHEHAASTPQGIR